MSVKRYTNGADDDQGMILPFMEESPEGEYVEYSDYAALQSKVQRLTEAGNELLGDYLTTGIISPPSQDAWNAAKHEQGCLVNPSKVAQYLPKPNAAKEGKQS